MARIITKGDSAGKLSFDLGDSLSFGRDPRNGVHLQGDSVSRFHAEIRRRGDSYVLVDLGSSNGTFLNDKRIEREILVNEDSISIGGFKFIYEETDEMEDSSYRPAETMFQSYTQNFMKTEFALKRSQSLDRFDEFISLVELCARPEDESKFLAELIGSLENLFSADYATVLVQRDEKWLSFSPERGKLVEVNSHSLVPSSIIDAACSKNEGVLMELPEEDRFRDKVSIISNQISTVMAVPFESAENCVLYLHRVASSRSYTKEDFRLLFAISIPARGAMESLGNVQRIKTDRKRLRNLLHGDSKILGEHDTIKYLKKLISKVAPLSSTVLITGSTGTGKELAARALHDLSPRSGEAFEAVNCAAISDSLVESELFGHEKGAFTGAIESRSGAFELADSGTLFLDEIGELTPGIQAKLLRVIENREVKRVGGSKVRKVNVRLVAATNRDLEKMVEEGKFRADLYYRIKVVTLELPDLAERRQDIALLTNYFLQLHSEKLGFGDVAISPQAMEALENYSWPGNIRELKNVIERAVILCEDDRIEVRDLSIASSGETRPTGGIPSLEVMSMSEVEKMHIKAVLKHTSGNKSVAASILGIDRSTLYAKLKAHHLER